MHGLISEKKAYRRKYQDCQPHAYEWRQQLIANKFFAEHIEQMKNEEKNNGNNQRHAHTAFPDDGTKRCAYKK